VEDQIDAGLIELRAQAQIGLHHITLEDIGTGFDPLRDR